MTNDQIIQKIKFYIVLQPQLQQNIKIIDLYQMDRDNLLKILNHSIFINKLSEIKKILYNK